MTNKVCLVVQRLNIPSILLAALQVVNCNCSSLPSRSCHWKRVKFPKGRSHCGVQAPAERLFHLNHWIEFYLRSILAIKVDPNPQHRTLTKWPDCGSLSYNLLSRSNSSSTTAVRHLVWTCPYFLNWLWLTPAWSDRLVKLHNIDNEIFAVYTLRMFWWI